MSFSKFLYSRRTGLLEALMGHRVAFHHVPKCAGSSVSRALRRKYALSQHSIGAPLSFATVKALAGINGPPMMSTELRRFRIELFHYLVEKDYFFVGGHVPFSNATYEKFGRGRVFVTVLRDPVERFVSQFLNNAGNNTYSGIEGTIDKFLATESAKRYGTRYCEYFSGNVEYKGPSKEVAEKAIENLSHFHVVGFTDNMAKFERELGKSLNTRIRIGRENVTKATVQKKVRGFGDDAVEIISELCSLDRYIYNEVRRARGVAI